LNISDELLTGKFERYLQWTDASHVTTELELQCFTFRKGVVPILKFEVGPTPRGEKYTRRKTGEERQSGKPTVEHHRGSGWLLRRRCYRNTCYLQWSHLLCRSEDQTFY